MPTLLTTPKMNPALRARVEASVGGKSRRPSARGASPRFVAIVRFSTAGAVLLLIGLVLFGWQPDDSEVERSRARLLSNVEQARKTLSPRELQLVTRTEALLLEAAQNPHDNMVDPRLRTAETRDSWLAERAVYVRGELAAFSEEASMRTAIHASVKDAFVLCLFSPPASGTETDLLAEAYVAFSGGLEKRTPQVRRLQSAMVGLSLLSRSWVKEVEDAPTLLELGRLHTAFDHAQIDHAVDAARATHLVYVFDEKPEEEGATSHAIRVGLVDVASGKPWLRTRRTLDDGWISKKNRGEMTDALMTCRVAFDLRSEWAAVDMSSTTEP
jgi:hypothetical protein